MNEIPAFPLGPSITASIKGSSTCDEPDHRTEIEDELRDLYKAMSVTTNPIPVKTAMNMIGLGAGPLRLPLVEASEEERAVIREALERHNLLAAV